MAKPKLALYWAASCGGCDVAVLDTNKKILDIANLVDIVFWTLYPDKAIDYKQDIELVSAKHWPTVMTAAQFETITKIPEFPSQFKLDKDGE